MRKPRDIKALLQGGSERLTSLKRRLDARSRVMDQVVAALPPDLAAAVVSAGVEQATLTLGAVSAAWATRLRYSTELLRQRVSDALGIEIEKVRVRVRRG